MLYQAAVERLGVDRIHVGHRLIGYRERDHDLLAHFELRGGTRIGVAGDALIGADGIHSALRAVFYPDEGPPAWNGHMLWRGAVDRPAYGDGRTVVIAGGNDAKLVYYPIHEDPARLGSQLTNWVIMARLGDGAQPPPRREDWNQPGRIADALRFVRRSFRLGFMDPVTLIEATGTFFEFPCCDRDPVPLVVRASDAAR